MSDFEHTNHKGERIDPSNPHHPLHSLTLAMIESQTQALEVFNSSDFTLINPSIIQQKLKHCGLIYLLSNNKNKQIINYLENKNIIANIIKYNTPQKINYFDLCSKMSSILHSNNNGPNKVYAINCKQYNYFNINQIETQNELYNEQTDDEYEDSSDDCFTYFEPEEDEKQNDTFNTNENKHFAHFREYILENYSVPPMDMLTFSSILNEYKCYNFDSYDKNNELISIDCSFGRNKLPQFHEYDNYVSIGMGLNDSYDWNRPKLNIIIALDVSNSMNNSFNSLNKNEKKSKMDITKYILNALLKHKINKYDRFGMIIFNNDTVTIIQSLQFINDIKVNNGSTNICDGYNMAIE
eukprot:5233_1